MIIETFVHPLCAATTFQWTSREKKCETLYSNYPKIATRKWLRYSDKTGWDSSTIAPECRIPSNFVGLDNCNNWENQFSPSLLSSLLFPFSSRFRNLKDGKIDLDLTTLPPTYLPTNLPNLPGFLPTYLQASNWWRFGPFCLLWRESGTLFVRGRGGVITTLKSQWLKYVHARGSIFRPENSPSLMGSLERKSLSLSLFPVSLYENMLWFPWSPYFLADRCLDVLWKVLKPN